MTIIADNTFAAACYDQNSIEEPEQALAGTADATDMNTWNLTEQEWRSEIKAALEAKREDDE